MSDVEALIRVGMKSPRGAGIVGGAVMPAIIGTMGNQCGLRNGMLLLYLTLGDMFSVGFWARPLVNNATFRLKKADISAVA